MSQSKMGVEWSVFGELTGGHHTCDEKSTALRPNYVLLS